ncbi:prolyl tripeptidyl peptidase [Fulvitalea axinellae]|uniref:Prolyl tripeptidyl peptidase n=1 Tax=Fulvitalea axinellae TaxID=1182444 RepID=A0AAU9CWG8_9BACT|nr:prolyl tripeptidyl peptidase [Fulvitalea axinellae]
MIQKSRLFLQALALLIFFAVSANAQKKDLTIDDAVIGQWFNLAPERVDQLQWVKGSSSYSFVKDNELMVSARKGEPTAIASLDDIKASNSNLSGQKRFPAITWENPKSFSFKTASGYFSYNTESKKAEKLIASEKGGENQDFSPKAKRLAYTIENNLFVNDNGNIKALSDEDNKAIVYGKVVHRNEFGVHKGTFWSPEGNLLAFYRNDQTQVTDYPITNIHTRPATNDAIKYPMAGMKNEKVTLAIHDFRSGKTVYLKTGDKDQYLTNVQWSPDEKYVYIAILNRDQNHLAMNRYNVATGELEATLFEENAEKYIQPLHPIMFLPKNSNEFLWESERDGFTHLYRYNTEGKLLNQVTKGPWAVTDIIGFDKAGRKIVVVGTDNLGLDRQVYIADVRTGKQRKITTRSGNYSVKLNKTTNQLIADFSSVETPHDIDVISLYGKQTKNILKAKNPLADYNVSPIEIFQIKADDGTPLNCRMIKPANFDESKQYPVLVYVYGGPNAQLIRNRWNGGISLWMQYMAQKGYIIFTMDSRGSENRGREFEQVTFRRLGEIEIKDQLKGVDYLKSQPYVDGDRLGVFGWSYGGFMTTSLMVKSPGTFKVGVAGGPVIDWSYYEIMYTERYMDTPQQNPEGYAQASLLDKTKNLNGDLLMIHGLEDDVVVIQHSLMFIENCVKNSKQMDYFVYPGHKHNVRGYDRIHLMQKVLDYVDDKLND